MLNRSVPRYGAKDERGELALAPRIDKIEHGTTSIRLPRAVNRRVKYTLLYRSSVSVVLASYEGCK